MIARVQSSATRDQLLEAMRELLSKGFGCAGATFRLALLREDERLRFITGFALFQPELPEPRETRHYDDLLLAEETVKSGAAAVDKLKAILEGEGDIAGHTVEHQFSSGYWQRFNDGMHGASGWSFTSRQDGGGQVQPWLLAPAVAYGRRPYASGYHAIEDWIYGHVQRQNTRSPDVSQHHFTTLVPDLRARILRAEWIPGKLKIETSIQIPPESAEVQVLFNGASDGYAILPLRDEIDCAVPKDTQEILLFVVNHEGEHLSRARLDSEYGVFGDAVGEASEPEYQVVEELAAGEGEEIEYKPWIKPKDRKEEDIVETAVAFANTRGGRIYVGVDDHGTPEGEDALCRMLQGPVEEAIKHAEDRIRSQLREKTKPVPFISCKIAEVRGVKVLIVEVAPGNQRPYSTHENKVFLRKGATNRLADPRSELPFLSIRGTTTAFES